MKAYTRVFAFSNAKKLAFCALFAALACVSTCVIVIPLPYGYANIGDVFVLMAGWCLGGIYGAMAGAVGSALADIVSGYAIYAPVTFLIKGLTATLAWLIYTVCKKGVTKPALDFIPRMLSAIVAEICMVAGYFLFECILYGFAGGVATLLGNGLQGAICVIGATALFTALKPVLEKYIV